MVKEKSQSAGFDDRKKEKEFLDREREQSPDLFERALFQEDDSVLAKVGIDAVFGERIPGHIKLYPEDFIVEEVSKDGVLHPIDGGPYEIPTVSPEEEVRTLWADLVKMGIDSFEAVAELSHSLEIDRAKIGIAGIKDKHALTAQWMSFRGVRPEALRGASAPNFFLKNISVGKGALQIGDLLGNRFTIFIRTESPVSGEWLSEKLADIEENGFWNFFYLQRFGTPRLLSHKLGLLILQGRFEDAVKMSVLESSEYEIPYFRNFHAGMLEQWGDWKTLLKALEVLSYSFKTERKMIAYLVEHPDDFAGALNTVSEQVKLWVYAYASFLFNVTLSRLIVRGEEVPYSLPLALSGNSRTHDIYKEFFDEHGIRPPFHALKNFPYVQRMEKEVEVLKKVKLYGWKIGEGGVILDFFLEKGSYATTFLSHLFVLSSGSSALAGILSDEVDSKALLGTGEIASLKENEFRELFEMREKKL